MTACTVANFSMGDVFKTGFYCMRVLMLLTLPVTYVPPTGLWLVNLVYSRPIWSERQGGNWQIDYLFADKITKDYLPVR